MRNRMNGKFYRQGEFYLIKIFVFTVTMIILAIACSTSHKKNEFFPIAQTDHDMNDTTPPSSTDEWNKLTPEDQVFLDQMQRKAFNFFWDGFHPETGLIANLTTRSNRTSIAGSGFCLTAYCIGIDRGWVTYEEAYKRILIILHGFYKNPDDKNDFCVEGIRGMFYHFVKVNTGKRALKCEVSTIDTGILMAGVLYVMHYFKGTEIEELARKIFLATEWDWFAGKKGVVMGGWEPEKGITAEYKGFNEYILVYLLGLSSPSHPLPDNSWNTWASGDGFVPVKPYKDIDACLTPHGIFQPLAYLYQFPACWYDFRDRRDAFADYWENAVNALKANKRYCNSWNSQYGLSDDLWGWTACNGKNGYLGFSAPYDGTVAPSAAVASLPFLPDESLAAVKHMYREYGEKIWGKYGFVDSFNPVQEWYDDRCLFIDKGNEILMLENFRSGKIWANFMQIPYIREGLKKAKLTKKNDRPV